VDPVPEETWKPRIKSPAEAVWAFAAVLSKAMLAKARANVSVVFFILLAGFLPAAGAGLSRTGHGFSVFS
jgi:hypothetical protein